MKPRAIIIVQARSSSLVVLDAKRAERVRVSARDRPCAVAAVAHVHTTAIAATRWRRRGGVLIEA